MAEVSTRFYVDSSFTLRQLIRTAYTGAFNDRYLNMLKDVKHRVRVESVVIHKLNYVNNLPVVMKVHTYRIRVVSIHEDGKVSNYPVTILLDYLSIDAPVKLRCGGLQKYTSKDTMDEKKICGDFYFRFMRLYKDIGLLYHRDSTNGSKAVTLNPNQSIGFCKHIWGAVRDLVESGFLGQGDSSEITNNKRMFQRLNPKV